MNKTENNSNKFSQYFEHIRSLIRENGKLIQRATSDWSADVYEWKGIKVAEGDVGYSTRIHADNFAFFINRATSPETYSQGSYDGYLNEEDQIALLPQMRKIVDFLLKSDKEWKTTIPDSFWLQNFKEKYPATHIMECPEPVKYSKL